MKCSVCKRETTALKIGRENYCSVCGNLYSRSDTIKTMDLTPRTAAAQPPAPTAPVPKPAAADLHSRVKPGHVLDLRAVKVPAVAPPVQPANHNAPHIPAPPPKTAAREQHLAHFSDRFDHAKQFSRSPAINKFSGGITGPAAPAAAPERPPARLAEPVAPAVIELPKLAATHHQAMARLITAPPAPAPAAKRSPLHFSPQTNRTLATAAAVAIMAGYIWVQNYPKLALQSANSQAGIAATLPGYVPTSYNLAHTSTSPGLITLSYGSPSADETLKISQARTTWDSSSLLDNFVAKQTDDYASVQSEGLTIYLFNNNQAAWVNHGIFYSIVGAARLSREQVLKIAYSL